MLNENAITAPSTSDTMVQRINVPVVITVDVDVRSIVSVRVVILSTIDHLSVFDFFTAFLFERFSIFGE